MADDTTRIINLTEATEIADGMYLVTDASTGTRKLALQKVIDKAGVNVADEYSSSSTYDVGDLCVYNGILYECTTAITTAEAWDSDHWEQVNLGDIIADMDGAIDDLDENKADKNGEYDYLTAGLANQLKSSVMTSDSQPFNFRTTGGSSDVGDREYLEMVGASAVVNQLRTIPSTETTTINDVAFTNNGDGTITVNGTASDDAVFDLGILTLETNGKYLLIGCPKGGSVNTYYYGNASYVDGGDGYIFNVTNAPVGSGNRIYVKSGTQVNNLTFMPMLINLTAYFGSNTIPDYIYSLEQGQAGAGITWIRNNCPILLEYHAYSQPTMKHVSGVTGYETTGVNQWDEVWELGYITTSGNNASSTTNIRSKNYIPVISGQDYYFMCPDRANVYATVCWYDSSKAFISSNQYVHNEVLTSPTNASYMRFSMYDAYGSTYGNDIQINLHWSGEMDGTYHPYEKHTYEISGDVTLRGVYKLDANNEPYCDGDVWDSEGNLNRRYGIHEIVPANIQNNGKDTTVNIYKAFYNVTGRAYTTNVICDRFVRGMGDMTVSARTTSNGIEFKLPFAVIGVNADDDAQTVMLPAAKTWFTNNVTTIVYELATPTTEDAPSYTSPQICNDWGTEEFLGTVEIPVGHNTKYPQNLRDKLQHLPDMAESDGDYIIRQDGTSMALIPLPEELPPLPQNDGTYKLSLTISSGEATLSWESES